MSWIRPYRNANDNDSPHYRPQGDSIGLYAARTYRFVQPYFPPDVKLETPLKSASQTPYETWISLWLASFFIFLGSLSLTTYVGLWLLLSHVTIAISLVISYYAYRDERNRLLEWAIAAVLLGFATNLYLGLFYLGIAISVPSALVIYSITSLVTAALIRSAFALIASISVAFIWGTFFLEGWLPLTPEWLVLPILAVFQIYLAVKYNIGTALLALLITLYIWAFSTLYFAYLINEISVALCAFSFFMTCLIGLEFSKLTAFQSQFATNLSKLISVFGLLFCIYVFAAAMWYEFTTQAVREPLKQAYSLPLWIIFMGASCLVFTALRISSEQKPSSAYTVTFSIIVVALILFYRPELVDIVNEMRVAPSSIEAA